jgi:outer membrane protein OmpA-like peptidoglycan-associated protein
MSLLILSLCLVVGQQSYVYNSDNALFREAPAFMLKVEVPPPTPKTPIPVKIAKPGPKREPKPLRLDIKEIGPPQIQPKPLSPPKVEKEEKCTETVYFDFDSFELKPSEKAKLDSLSRDIEYRVRGYTCDIGPKDYNDRLALKRADAVRGYLGSIVKEVGGKGKCCYADKTDKSKNRRVEIKPLPGVSQFNNQPLKKNGLKSKEALP